MSLRILVTGSREWIDRAEIRDALDRSIAMFLAKAKDGNITVVHGAARGADTIADQHAESRGWVREPHPVLPADWDRYGKSAGHRRNAAMVAAGADVCLAFPLNWAYGQSRGTRDCVDLARAAGITTVVYDGNEPEEEDS